MLTRRTFLSAAGTLLASPVGFARAEAYRTLLRFKQVSFPPAPLNSSTKLLAVEGLSTEGAFHLASGQPSDLRVANALGENLKLSWRGLRGVGEVDRPAPTIGPVGESSLPISPPDPGTAMLRAAPSLDHLCQRGAQAVVIISGQNEPMVDRDLVLHLNDWLLTAEGVPVFGSVPPAAARSCLITANGSSTPETMAVPARGRVRLRIVNGSTQRPMLVTCQGTRPMIAAIDGQPSELFAPVRNTIPIGPGARYDLLFDMPETLGAEVRFALKPTLSLAGKLENGRDLLVLHSEGNPLGVRPEILALPPNPALPDAIPLETARRLEVTVDGQPGTADRPPSGWSFSQGGKKAPSDPVLVVRRGDAVTLGFTNATATLVPLRIAGHAVRLLHAKDDGWEPYWRDTLMLPPKGRLHVAFIADSPGRWPIDSGFDDLTLAGLSCYFTVLPA